MSKSDGVQIGQKVAAVLMLLNGVVNLFVMMTAESSTETSIILQSPAPFVIDILLSLALLSCFESVLGFVIFRVILGSIVIVAVYATQGDAEMVVGQLIFSISLLALLLGKAGPVRIGVVVVGLSALLVVGLINDPSILRTEVSTDPQASAPEESSLAKAGEATRGLLAKLGPEDLRNHEAIVACGIDGTSVYMREGDCATLGGTELH